jgi:hypothetical protein
MRAASRNKATVTLLGIVFLTSACAHFLTRDVETDTAVEKAPGNFSTIIQSNATELFKKGEEIFRYDTFGSEAFWGDQLQLHRAILGEKLGGIGSGLTPKDALKIGLKVDIGKLPRILVDAIKQTSVSLENPKTTVALLQADSVVGVKGFFEKGNLRAVGITCAICHSTVDNSFADGIGRRLDGWPNRDLNVGAIIALAPNLKPFTALVGHDDKELRRIFNSWGPGRYDAEFNMDGKGFRPDGKSASTLLPAAFGLAGVNLHTYTGWGSVTHWNAYVANTQMQGKGTFFDPRLNKPEQFPAAVKSGIWNKRDDEDLITSKLAALHYYQLSIPAPIPPKNSYNAQAADRGKAIFGGKARCATCHVPPLFTEPGWNMHTAQEIGIDDFQANRSPDRRYRTTPLKGLFTRMKGGFYHDGRFASLSDVVEHYNKLFKAGLTEQEKLELIEYLKSL